MVAPVADVRPRVMRILHLPLIAIAHNAIGVMAIASRGINKPEDHAFDVAGKGQRQRLPVLENVAPIALVVQYAIALIILDLDSKYVPGAAGVTVTAAESKRQVFVSQSVEIKIILFARPCEKDAMRQGLWHRIEKSGLPKGQCVVSFTNERFEIGSGNQIAMH